MMYKYITYIIILIIVIFAAVFTLLFMRLKKYGICPICALKQHFHKRKITMKIPDAFYDGGDAVTPPMGWSSWNTFRNNISQELIIETAEALIKSGLADAGYKFINLDDCWQSSLRDENGKLQGDLVRFPDGIKSLVAQINAMGLKLGIYSSNGICTCEDLPASLGHEKIDAETFADWGIEYLKYDYCHEVKIPSAAPLVEKIEIYDKGVVTSLEAESAMLSGLAKLKRDKSLKSGRHISFLGHGKGSAEFEYTSEDGSNVVLTLFVKKSGKFEKFIIIDINGDIYEMQIPSTFAWSPDGRYQIRVKMNKGINKIRLYNPVCTRADSTYLQYKRMGEELKNVSKERKITYSICEHGKNNPQDWAWNVGNLWRTTPDIIPNWKWIMAIYNRNLKLSRYAGKGHWNDPDMLEVGNGKLAFDENKSHFSLWCMMSAPLILGNDVRLMSGENDEKHIIDIVGNREMIAIDQDNEYCCCMLVKRTHSFDYLVKKLGGNSAAICVLNRSSCKKTAVFSAEDILFGYNIKCTKLREIWSGKEYQDQAVSISIPAHGCAVFKTIQ